MSSLQLADELFGACDVLWNTTAIRNAVRDDPQFKRFQATLHARLDATLLSKADTLGKLLTPHPLSVVLQAAIELLRGDLAGDERAVRAAALRIGIHDHIEKASGGPCDGCKASPLVANTFREWAWSGLNESSRDEAIRKLRELEQEA